MNDFDKVDKIAILDIEALDLKAEWSPVICACVKTVYRDSMKGPIKTFRLDEYGSNCLDDKALVSDLNNYLDEQDLVIGWYSSRYDFPFLNARSLMNNLLPPVRNYRRDLWFCSKGNLALNSHRLAHVARHMTGATSKTALTFKHKIGVINGKKESYNYYVEHCKFDVIDTEKVYKKLIPLLGKLRK